MKRKKDIYHIYWGTAGNAGLYLDEIYQALESEGYSQKAFVSYYYPFNYGEKVFFKRTEMEHCQYKGIVRKVLQVIEFLYALFVIWQNSRKDKPRIINYSYVSRGNVFILLFLKLIKKASGCKLVITCHDVIPIIENKTLYDKEIAIKTKIFSLADYYLVHTETSRNELQQIFSVEDNQMLMHLFPLMDLSKLDNDKGNLPTRYDYLFIGHMRPEKGVSILLEAWKHFHKDYPQSTLCIAGNPYYYKEYIDEHRASFEKEGVEFKLGFIKDDDYIRIVKSARCVVFPYTGGTNSGVISTVVSLGKDVITSDLGMFANNPFVPKENMFKTGDIESLVDKLTEYKRGMLISDSKERVSEFRMVFKEQVKEAYSHIMQS